MMLLIEIIVILPSSVLLNFRVIRLWLLFYFLLFLVTTFTVSMYDYVIVNTIYRRSIST